MIVYFSATGNSRHVVDLIRKGGERIVRMDAALKNDELTLEVDDGRLGIVTPTYAWTMPSVVADFLTKVTFTFKERPYVFCVATYGTTAGASGQMANAILRGRGLGADALFDVRMPDTWTPIFDLSDLQKVARNNAEADSHIVETRELIAAQSKGDFRDSKTPLFTGRIGKALYDGVMRRTKMLSVTDVCVGCGLCARKCPVDAIAMRDGKPVWCKDTCAMCLGCLHRCPAFAIEYGPSTKKHGQYVHPAVSVKDL